MQGLIQQFAKGGGPTRSLPVPFFSPFPFSPLPLPLQVGPIKPARGSGLGSAVSSSSGDRDRAPARNEFGAL